MRVTVMLFLAALLVAAPMGCGKEANTTFTTLGKKDSPGPGGARDFAESAAEPFAGDLSAEHTSGDKGKEKLVGKASVAEDDSKVSPKEAPSIIGGLTASSTLTPAPTSAPPVATEGKADSPVAALPAPASPAPDPASKAMPPTPPAVADAIAGTAKTPKAPKNAQSLPSGVLTAGSFDDNLDPAVFHSFVAKRAQSAGLGDLPKKMVGHRLLAMVRDAANKPVGNARVKLAAEDGKSVEIVTRSDGKAVFMLSFDQLPADQPLTATVTSPDGGATITEKVSPAAPRWEFTLPSVQAQLPRTLDLAIVLDTTGSMQDEIDHLKAEIRGISAAIKKKFPEVEQRFALVLYRDEGDEYVTRTFDFTTKLDKFQQDIAAQSANGGDDYPEAMHKGLEAANQLRWREKDAAKVMFLIADAPPHHQHMNRTLAAANGLRKKGVAIYPVACSGYDDDCEFVMRSSALLTGSQFLFLTDDSGVGNSHAEPKIPYYRVERLERMMVRMIAGELSGQRIEPSPQDILRTVGAKRGN